MPVPLRSRSQWMFWAPRFPQTGICLELVVRNSFCLKLEQLEIMFIWCVASRVKRWGFQKQHNSRGSAGSPIITYLSWETSFKPPLVPWSSYHGYVDGMTPFKDDHEIQNTTGHLQSTVRKSSRFCRPSKRTRTPGLCPRVTRDRPATPGPFFAPRWPPPARSSVPSPGRGEARSPEGSVLKGSEGSGGTSLSFSAFESKKVGRWKPSGR